MYGHYLYETGESFWQCANVWYNGGAGFLVTEEQSKIVIAERKNLFKELFIGKLDELLGIKRDEANAKREAAQQKKKTFKESKDNSEKIIELHGKRYCFGETGWKEVDGEETIEESAVPETTEVVIPETINPETLREATISVSASVA